MGLNETLSMGKQERRDYITQLKDISKGNQQVSQEDITEQHAFLHSFFFFFPVFPLCFSLLHSNLPLRPESTSSSKSVIDLVDNCQEVTAAHQGS